MFYNKNRSDNMSKMIGAPTRYRQGKDELKCLGDDLKIGRAHV